LKTPEAPNDQIHQLEGISLPRIGAGLGKLDWEEEVKALMIKHFADPETIFYVYEDFKREYEPKNMTGTEKI
jgi:O-acetyl-ADP-ribose deacetylase (regulator of RNase III)